MKHIKRHIYSEANEVMESFPAIVIQGARQVGKSTLATDLVSTRKHAIATFDDYETREFAKFDPSGFVNQIPDGTLVIDEIQRVPELMLTIKSSIDKNPDKGRFLLTGSSDLLKISRTGDSLAGRIVSLDLQGFSQGELHSTADDFTAKLSDGNSNLLDYKSRYQKSDYIKLLAKGGYPALYDLSPKMRNIWIKSYLDRLFKRDVAELSPMLSSARLQKLFNVLSANQSGEMVMSRIAQDIDIPNSSMPNYLDALESLFIIYSLKPWSANLTSREKRKHKVSICDSAIAMSVSKISEHNLTSMNQSYVVYLGSLLEAFVVSELRKQQAWTSNPFEIYHFQDRDLGEVDIVLEFNDGSVFLIEVKASSSYSRDDYKTMLKLGEKLGDRFIGGAVLGTTQESRLLASKIWGLPISIIWE